MKKVYIIHGWGGSSRSEPWFSWLKTELTKKKFEVLFFDMPNTDNPKIEEWVGFLQKNIKNVDEETYFVGHSIGCQTILRFLEKLPKSKKIAGCVFVAGFFNLITHSPEELAIAHPWTNTKINCLRILTHCNNNLAIFSDDDPDVSLEESKKFERDLEAKIIIKHKQEHFTETEKIPEILDFIK